jgi:hypothetical protein
MISYLSIDFTSQIVPQSHRPYLADLIHFRLAAVSLEVDPFFHTLLSEDMVTSSHAHFETQPEQQLAQFVKIDIRIGISEQNLLKQLFVLAHLVSASTPPS